jgi:hypothetical protein
MTRKKPAGLGDELATIAKRVSELESQLREAQVNEVRLGTYLDVAVEVMVTIDDYLSKFGRQAKGSKIDQALNHGRRVIKWHAENRKG